MVSKIREDWNQWVAKVPLSTPWFNEVCGLCHQIERMEHDLKNAHQTLRLIARHLSQNHGEERGSK